MSVATLGLEISSAGLKQAPVDLDKLTASAARAERATESLGTSATGAFSKTGTQATEMGRRIQEATKSASIATEQNGAIAAAARRSGISYSEMAARIANASQSAVASSGKFVESQSVAKSKLYDLEKQQDKTSNSAINFANTLTRRFVLGYAVSQIKSLTGALVLLNNEVAKVGDLGNITGTGSTLAQGLVSSAGYKGIQGDSLASAMVAFNQQVPLAKAGVGSLGELLRKNGVTVSDTADAFFKVADLVKNASDGAARMSILQQAGLPATIEMAKYLGQGADAIKAQSQESTQT